MQIGTDIVSIDRIKESLERFGDRFLDRVFNQEERDTLNLNRVQSVAGYWASKEGDIKGFGVWNWWRFYHFWILQYLKIGEENHTLSYL